MKVAAGNLGFQGGHTDPRLSDLDLAMICHVRPGGNWQDIPESIPSTRLEQIRRMTAERGVVRTTYYGRLRADQPSYTVATYYDRPGNGTNIHPWEHRTISHREAARLQSFPDKFEFVGSRGAVKRQIGNAVPPLMAFALGRLLGRGTFVDLFSGAGGLSCGLRLAGLTPIAAQDIDRASAATYTLNHPNVKMIIGDILSPRVKASLLENVQSMLGRASLDVVAGGPPCQGFSTAGWRLKSDSRNALAYEYLDIIQQLRPRAFLFENVEGILSMQGGRMIHELIKAFRTLGYKWVSEPWIAYCEQYGVPQMRRRVILMGSLDVTDAFGLPTTYFDRCHGRREREHHRTSRYPITVAEAFKGLPPIRAILKDYFPRYPVDDCYSKWVNSEISTMELLEARGEIQKDGFAMQRFSLLS